MQKPVLLSFFTNIQGMTNHITTDTVYNIIQLNKLWIEWVHAIFVQGFIYYKHSMKLIIFVLLHIHMTLLDLESFTREFKCKRVESIILFAYIDRFDLLRIVILYF